MHFLVLAAQLLGSVNSVGVSERVTMGANPVRRVVNLLTKMKHKVEEEGKKDEEVHEKYACWCKTSIADLETSVEEASNKQPQLEASVKQAVALKKQLDAEISEHKQDKADIEEALAKAKSIRKKEEAAFSKESAETKTNIKALGKAISQLEAGSSEFLQTAAGSTIRKLAIDADMGSTDRDILSRFLAQDDEGYTPQSGEISGILKQMKDTMVRSLHQMEEDEAKAQKSYESIVAAKNKEHTTSTHAIEKKLARVGDTSVEIESHQNDLDDTAKCLSEDQTFLAHLQKDCATKEEEWEAVQKTRAMELQAIAETIKILNDDDALDLFKKTLPSPSLLQMKVTASQMRHQALRALQRNKRGRRHLPTDPRMDFITLILHGKKMSFEKVIKLINQMVELLKKEQVNDDHKVEFCNKEFDTAEDKSKALGIMVSDINKALDDAKGQMQAVSEEIVALEKSIKDLDQQVVEATATRKAENEAYKENVSSSRSARELLLAAKNRLNKFYNPKLYTEGSSAADLIMVGMSGVARASDYTAWQGSLSLVQMALSTRKDAPPPPPETVDVYMKKSGESAGVMQMIGVLVTDLEKELTEMKVEEDDSQAAYEKFVKDSIDKRTVDLKSVADKGAAKADVEETVEKLSKDRKSNLAKNMAVDKYLSNLHGECDWLLSNAEVRTEARANELDSLEKARDVLSGADFSLVQVHHGHTHVHAN